jgi:anthranilate synthase/phosphoribosyltransferase
MGVRHRDYPVEGVQFHPESVASEAGKRLLANFLRYKREPFVVNASLSTVLEDGALDQMEAANFMEELTDGNLTPAQIAGFLVAMNAKGITPEEIAGCASVLQRKRTPIVSERPVLDTCGTGGDGLGTFNISSFTALVAAAAGVPVAKHGNRAVSSRSGSADFYRALGIEVNLSPDGATRLLRRNDFAFLYAPIYHQAMRHAAVPRRELGIKTIMNLLGPLVNPAGAAYQLIGVFDAAMCGVVARAAHLLGIKRALVVHGADGLDEISVSGPTTAVHLDESGNLREMTISPEELGLPTHELSEIAGGSAEENAEVALALARDEGPAALRAAVAINAGAALWVAGKASSLGDGHAIAVAALKSGRVLEKLESTIRLSNEIGVAV